MEQHIAEKLQLRNPSPLVPPELLSNDFSFFFFKLFTDRIQRTTGQQDRKYVAPGKMVMSPEPAYSDKSKKKIVLCKLNYVLYYVNYVSPTETIHHLQITTCCLDMLPMSFFYFKKKMFLIT